MSSLDILKKINAMAEFNRWCGIEVTAAEAGVVEIQLPLRPEVGLYSGYLHAGLIGTLIDTACGFAAATVAGPNLLAAHFSVNCLRPALQWVRSSLRGLGWSSQVKRKFLPTVICTQWMQRNRSWWQMGRPC